MLPPAVVEKVHFSNAEMIAKPALADGDRDSADHDHDDDGLITLTEMAARVDDASRE